MKLQEFRLQLTEAWAGFWKARNRRERNFLLAAAAACVIGAVYALLIEPALTQRAKLERGLPALRMQVTQMQQLTQQATQLVAAPRTEPLELTRDALEMSLKNLGLAANEINVSERTVQLQFASASLVRLLTWLEQLQQKQLSVTDADIQVQANSDMVKATVILTKITEQQ